ncbi:MAG: hypothetical protein ABWY14_06590 [Tardiphaga sp.]
MRRQVYERLRAQLISFQRAIDSGRRSAHGGAAAPVSPLLVFVAISLLLVLVILEVELHREQLKALGLLSGDEGASPVMAGP